MEAGQGRLLAGCMSGTSADGIDTALLHLDGAPLAPRWRILALRADPFDPDVRSLILACSDPDRGSLRDAGELHLRLGELFATSLTSLCRDAGVVPDDLDAVGLHGQTLRHDPDGGLSVQIGSAAVVAETLRCDVIHDFRSRDLAAGGQGAPLVPYADAVLLRNPGVDRIALNIGGIANLTWLPAGEGLADVAGFDTGPGNMIMDGIVSRATGGQKSCDHDGELAARGAVLSDVLAEWLAHPFFSRSPPRSTGREEFGAGFIAPLGERIDAGGAVADLVRTALEFTVESIARAVERWLPPLHGTRAREMIVSGGGARNPFLTDRLARRMAPVAVVTSDEHGLPADGKEAIAFALLADAFRHGVPAGIPAVTGARRACVLGALVPGESAIGKGREP